MGIHLAYRTILLDEEVEIQGIVEGITSGIPNFKYSIFPFFLVPLKILGFSLYETRVFMCVVGALSIFIPYLYRYPTISFIIAFLPMHIYISSLAKADIFIFIFTLLILIHLKGKRAKDVILVAILSSLCISFKYWIPSFISALVLVGLCNRRKLSLFFLISAVTLFITFLPAWINLDYFIQGIKNQYELHYKFEILSGKSIPSALLVVLFSISSISVYSIFMLPLIVWAMVVMKDVEARKEILIFFIFFLVNFVAIYVLSEHLFAHYYFPCGVPLLFLVDGLVKRNKKAVIYFILVFAITLFKTKNYYTGTLERAIAEFPRDQRFLILVPKQHFFLKYVLSKSDDFRFQRFYIGLLDNYKHSNNREYDLIKILEGWDIKVLIIDITYEEFEISTSQLRKEKRIDGLTIFFNELDTLEKIMFPIIKNIIPKFIFEVYLLN